jgi:DNA-binding PadR family transcriptional regulator
LASEQKTDGPTYCPQRVVEHLVSRWTNVNLTKELNRLLAAKLIVSRIRPHDKRERELTLTTKGRQVLEEVKNQRREVLELLFDKLDSDQMTMVASGLDQVAAATWPKMKESAPSSGEGFVVKDR